MSEYLEVFRVEAKTLLKNFRNHQTNAVAQCQAVFGDKLDLSLMNTQHIIAKKYSFNSWNELAAADNAQLAEALIEVKSHELHTPFRTYMDGKKHSSFETNKQILKKQHPNLDLINLNKNASGRAETKWLYLQHLDLSEYDLSALDLTYTTYSEETIWPKDKSRLPAGFEPKDFLENRKNPGLGIRNLHKQGLDGKGRAAAIIDWQILRNHLEYHHNLKGYEEIHQRPDLATSSGGSLVSVLTGKTCGVAPNADIYYYSADNAGKTQRYYAEALNKVCDQHLQLRKEGKNGIDVVCILWALTSNLFKNFDGADEMAKALSRADELGIWVNCGDVFARNRWHEACLYCPMDGGLDNSDDYKLFSNGGQLLALPENIVRRTLCFPGAGRTVAVESRLNAYEFSAPGFYLKPFECGLYILAKSIKTTLTPQEFWQAGFDTGDFRKDIGVIINPQRLIETLRK